MGLVSGKSVTDRTVRIKVVISIRFFIEDPLLMYVLLDVVLIKSYHKASNVSSLLFNRLILQLSPPGRLWNWGIWGFWDRFLGLA